jgi:hypothetical protein
MIGIMHPFNNSIKELIRLARHVQSHLGSIPVQMVVEGATEGLGNFTQIMH